MNIPLSFLLLNPLEALVVILGCDVFTARKFNLKQDIKYCYILGTINLIIQILLNYCSIGVFGLIINFIVPIFISPILTMFYYNKTFNNYNIRYLQTLIIQCLYISSMFLLIYIFNNINNNIYTTIYHNIYYETIINIFKFFIQILMINILKRSFIKCMSKNF